MGGVYLRLLLLALVLAPGAILIRGCAGGPEQGKGIVQTEVSAAGTVGQPRIEFEKDLHQFGTIFSGERVVYSFRFTNTGDAPLVITGTRSSCGCTAGQYTRDPVPPGERGFVSVEFNSAGRNGFQQETLWVQTNMDGPDQRLRITAEVIRN
jgi:hypothetical protein